MSTIAPNDANILYSPYNWLVSAGTAKTISGGAYLRATFTGTPTVLTATFNMTNQPATKSRVGFRVDGGPWQDFDVAATITLSMPANTWASHTVEMVVIATTEGANRWNAPQDTAVVLTGITGDVAIATRTQRARKLYGMAFGDSITEGVRTLNMTATADTNRNDSRLAWAYPLGEMLGAEIGVVGMGGTGIAKVGSGNVPAFPSSAPYLWAGQARSLTTPKAPDFIVAHVGANDSASTDADVTANITTLVNAWATATPESTRIFIMAGWTQRKAAAIIAGIAAAATPRRVTYIDTTGWWNSADASDSLHPYGYINITDLSQRVAVAIRPGTGVTGTTYIRNDAGAAIPVSTRTT